MRKIKKRIPEQIRQQVFIRDNFTCRYCGSSERPLHVDHVYPEALGGITDIKNLVTACEKCNIKKNKKIGIWPRPIGYFDELNKNRETEIEREKLSSNISAINTKTNNFYKFLLFFGLIVLFLTPIVFGTVVNNNGTNNKYLMNIIMILFGIVPFISGLSAYFLRKHIWKNLE